MLLVLLVLLVLPLLLLLLLLLLLVVCCLLFGVGCSLFVVCRFHTLLNIMCNLSSDCRCRCFINWCELLLIDDAAAVIEVVKLFLAALHSHCW